MLRKKTKGVAIGSQTSSFIGKTSEKVVDRRTFLKGSGLAVGGLATVAALTGSNVKSAKASFSTSAVSMKKTVCTHCSVGCTIMAEVQNGVWTGQEPGWDSPINLGAHCSKGASVRETASGERRLKYLLSFGRYDYYDILHLRYYPGSYDTISAFFATFFPILP